MKVESHPAKGMENSAYTILGFLATNNGLGSVET